MKWAWVLIASGIEVWADYFLKKWSINNRPWDALVGAVLYGVGALGWGFLLRYITLQRAIILFAAANMLGVFVVGHFVFGERMSARDYTAAVFCLLALFLVEG